MDNTIKDPRRMRVIMFDSENDLYKISNKLTSQLFFIPTLAEFLRDFYRDHKDLYKDSDNYYDSIFFIGPMKPAEEWRFIDVTYLSIRSNGYIEIRGFDKEERKELTNAVLHYRLDTILYTNKGGNE